MDIGIFIEYNNRVVQIPVNPAEFNVDTQGNNETVEIIALGEVIIPRKKKLSSISWESFFPYDSWYPAIRTSGDFKSAAFYVNFLDGIRNDCRPCHLTVTGIGFDDDVVIESFDYYHQAGDHEDTYYSITFKRYQPYAVSIISKVDIESQIKKIQSTVKPTSSASQTTTSNPANRTTMGKPSSDTSITINSTQVTIGSELILNGRVHSNSYGDKPGKTFTNQKVKVSLINKKGTHPCHVTTLSGSPLGWVTKQSLSFSVAPAKKPSLLKPALVETFSPTLRNPGGVGARSLPMQKAHQ